MLAPAAKCHFFCKCCHTIHRRSVVLFVITEPLRIVHRAFDRLTQPSFRYTQHKTFRQTRAVFRAKIPVRLFSLVQLCYVFVLPSMAAHKNQRSVVILCTICTVNACCTAVCVPVVTKYRTDCFLCGSLFIINDF